jgi:hypothetical protein
MTRAIGNGTIDEPMRVVVDIVSHGQPLADIALAHRVRQHYRFGLQHRGVGLVNVNLGFARRSASRTV